MTDRDCANLFWLIPISSKVEKYKEHYRKKVDRYGKCNTIYFADVLGHERAFLIQNMFPITKKYITEIYVDHSTSNAVRISSDSEKDIVKKAREVLKLHKRGIHVLFADVDLIYEKELESIKSLRIDKVDTDPETTPWNDLLVRKNYQQQKQREFKKEHGLERDDD